MTADEIKQQALHAQQLLEDPLLVGSLDKLERNLRLLWEESDPSEAAAREEAWRMLRAARKFRLELQTMVQAGVDQAIVDQADNKDE